MTEPCFDEAGLSSQPLGQPEALGDARSPFVHRFKTARCHYLFDVNTNRILRVSKAVWDIIADVGVLDEHELVAKYSSTHAAYTLSAARREVLATQERGMFLAHRPTRITAYHQADLADQLDHKRGQLILNLTEACNFRCSYCIFGGQYSNRRKHSSRRMEWQTARAAIDDFMQHSDQAESRFVTFYGGEPLLEDGLLARCVEYVKAENAGSPVQFSLTTNGSLLAARRAAYLAANEFFIIVSLDGPEPVHDSHRRTLQGEPTWATVMDNVRAFLDAYPSYKSNSRLRFSAVVPPGADLRELQTFFCEHDLFTECTGVSVSPQSPSVGEAPAPDDVPRARSYKSLREQFLQDLASGRVAESYGSRETLFLAAVCAGAFIRFHRRKYLSPRLPDVMTAPSTCIPGARRTFVSVDGDYFACERVSEGPGNLIGDVKNGIDMGKVMKMLDQWNESSDQCRRCWCLPICAVGCFASVGDDAPLGTKVSGQACSICRQQSHELMEEYSAVMERNPHAFDFARQFESS